MGDPSLDPAPHTATMSPSATTATNGTPAAASTNGNGTASSSRPTFALKGGVIMDVVNAEQARIAEAAGACAVMALQRIPSDIRRDGGVARMSDPKMIKEIMDTVSIPVMAKSRIGHIVEAEVLTPADPALHVDKHAFDVPFVCGCKDLGEALRRISEGAAMIRTKGEAGTGNVIEAVRHARKVDQQIKLASTLSEIELYNMAKEIQAPVDLLRETARLGRLPVVMFSAGGIATPADAALMMKLGMDGVFVGSGIFKSENPEALARAVVLATTHYQDPLKLAEVSEGLGEGMKGENKLGAAAGKEMTADRGY